MIELAAFGARDTEIYGPNEKGVIVGTYQSPGTPFHGLIIKGVGTP